MKQKMKTPITYYGGKQNLVKKILPLFPKHNLYAEPFFGGGALFWAKERSNVEVVNDTNRELINFYDQVKNNFIDLERKIRIQIHSRSLHNDAVVINANPHMFTAIERACALWVLSAQSFASKLDGSWGYDKKKPTTSKKINNKIEAFTENLAIRLQNVQIENTDAIRIINSRDTPDSLFYCDPPYYNSDCGHYDGYSVEDFELLLKTLQNIEGKFVLSSYPSEILKKYTKVNAWHQVSVKQNVSINNKGQNKKVKIEVMTANFPL